MQGLINERVEAMVASGSRSRTQLRGTPMSAPSRALPPAAAQPAATRVSGHEHFSRAQG